MDAEKPRIAVELHGGLGNQLFQAAAALALGGRLGETVAFDISRFRAGTKRRYELDIFPHGATTFRTPALLRRAQKWLGKAGFGRDSAPFGVGLPLYVEPGFHFDPGFATLSGPIYLRGLFQSPRYFEGHEERLRAIFALAPHASPAAHAVAESLSPRSLAIHIRAGDYQDPKFADVHHVLAPDYYQRAIARLRDDGPIDEVIVMSDTKDAIPSRLPGDLPYRIVSSASALDDLFLMSRAGHNIIANSTFSWWGAWLGAPAGRRVIAPQQWFAPVYQARVNTADLFPPNWVVL